MKISIWQQFSSNHSAHYFVVGKFRTPDEAATAAKELNSIALQIKETTPLRYIVPDGEGYQPTPVEIEIGKRFGITWEHGVDWAYWRETWTNNQPTSSYQNTVWFVSPHPFTWQGPQPVDQLM